LKIRVACIGAGYFARFHLEAWRRIPEVEVVAVCDKDLVKAQELASAFQIKNTYDNANTLCEKEVFEVIDIITPPDTHLELCERFSRQGKHIICQKPLAPTPEEARAMVKLTGEAGVRFMVHENFRFQPWYRQIKILLEKGVIGDQLHTLSLRMRTGDGWKEDAYLDRQPYFRTMPRLLVYETAIHHIDVFRFLAGDITSVYARLRKLNPVIAGEDCGLILFNFKNGGQGIWDGNRYNEPNYDNPRYTFGETTMEGNGGTIRLYHDGRLTVQPLGRSEQTVDYHHEDLGFGGDCVYFTQRHFVESFLHCRPFETNGADYLKNLIIQEAIYESHEQRKEIKILFTK
jgi:predicted dehydrogenase